MPSLLHPIAAPLDVEVADTPERRQRGLLGRGYLHPNTGMLFVFDRPALYSFTMYGMAMSLDLILLDESWRVVGTLQMPKKSTQHFRGEIPYKYAVETRWGWVEENNIRLGDFFRVQAHPWSRI